MRALSGADVLAENKLFATLDPVTRRLRLASGEVVLLTDTVGFIQKLPTDLVAAFRATLEEVAEADLLLHVIDISHPAAFEQTQAVEKTLADIGANQSMLLVLNKLDRLTDEEGHAVADFDDARGVIHGAGAPPRNVALISARRKWGLERLLLQVEEGLDGAFDDIPRDTETLFGGGAAAAI
jgi:GTP-binding protein HflX